MAQPEMLRSQGSVDRISLFMPSLVGGGAERVFLTLAEQFLDKGIEVDLVVAGRFGDLSSQVDARARVIDLGKRRVFSALAGLARYLRAEKPGVLLCALTHANLTAIGANRLAGKPARLIVTEHLSPRVNAGWKHRMLYPLAKVFYRCADAVVAVSNGVADDFRALLGKSTPVQVIYNPIKLARINEMASQVVDHPWLVEKNLPVYLSAGRLHPNKDFATLLHAFALVNEKRPARLIIIGQGEERERLETLAVSLGVQGSVSMPGFIPNPFAFMQKADVFVMASVFEGLPMVLIEALACGATIVATDCPSGPDELLEHGKYGRLVPVRDPQRLADAMLKALDTPTNTQVLQQYAKKFDAITIAGQYLDLIKSVLKRC